MSWPRKRTVRPSAECRRDRKETMIVAMQAEATEEQIQGVIEQLVRVGFNVHRTTGAVQTILAGVGMPAHFDHKDFEVARRRQRGGTYFFALQTGRQKFPSRGNHHRVPQRGEGRRQAGSRDGRSLLGRVAGADLYLGAPDESCGGAVSARRRLQAAQLALLLPGHGLGRAQAAARSRR